MIKKSLKNLLYFYLSNPVPFNGQDYEKQKRPGTSNQLLVRLQNKVQKNSFTSDVLPDSLMM